MHRESSQTNHHQARALIGIHGNSVWPRCLNVAIMIIVAVSLSRFMLIILAGAKNQSLELVMMNGPSMNVHI